MIEQGIVDKIEENSAYVKIYKSDACDSCNLCDSGGQPEEKILHVNNILSSNVGDWVQIDIPSSTVIKSAFMIFFLPVIAMIFGYFLGQILSRALMIETEFIKIITGLIFTGISFRVIRIYDRRMSLNEAHLPRMKQILYSNKKGADV